jgi:hypothetical protein
MFYWGCQDQRRTFALVAVCLLFSNYYFLLWGRAIMLEVPALAMMLLFVLSAQRYFSNSTFVNSLLLGVIGFCMLMTKQTVLFILPVVLLIGVINYQWRNWLTLKIIPATVLVSCGLAGIAAHALVIGKSGFGQVTQSAGGGLASYLFSSLPNAISVMYEHYGPWMLALALLGAIVGIRNGDRRAIAVYLAWIVAGILFLAFLSNTRGNLLRYGIYLAPPIYLLVVQAVQLPTSNKRLSYIWYALCFGLFSFSFFNAYSVGYPTLDGYEESADFVSDLPNGPIMFCCKHDGNFTFYMRRNDPQRRSLILRADKILVSIVINVSRGVVEHAESVDDIRKLLDRNFVRYLVLEDRTLQQVGQFERLRRFAESDSFKKLNTNQVTSSLPAFDGLKIAVYEYLDVPESTGGEVSIPFPHLGHTIILGID